MKTPLRYLLFFLFVVSSTSNEARAQNSSSATANRATLVALLDTSHVFKNHERFKQRMEVLKQEIKALDEDMKRGRDRLSQLQQKLADLKPGTSEYNQLEADIARQMGDLQIRARQKQMELMDEEARVYHETYVQIEREVAALAERFGIGLVLRFDRDAIDPQDRSSVLKGVNRAVVYQRNLDITEMVLERVNIPQTSNR